MTRKIIAREGKPTVLPGIWLDKDAIKMEKDRVPVVHSFNYEEQAGWASDLKRDEETGEVSVEVEFFNKYSDYVLDEELFRFTFAAHKLEQHQVPATDSVPEHTLVTSCELMWVSSAPIEALMDIS